MLSTHIMQEVEAICDRIVIINKGCIVANDKTLNLQETKGEQTVFVEFDQPIAKSQLTAIPGVTKVEAIKNGWLIGSDIEIDLRKEVAQFAQKKGWLTLTLTIEKKSLEDVFKNLTK